MTLSLSIGSHGLIFRVAAFRGIRALAFERDDEAKERQDQSDGAHQEPFPPAS
jgi:hypothetical protein